MISFTDWAKNTVEALNDITWKMAINRGHCTRWVGRLLPCDRSRDSRHGLALSRHATHTGSLLSDTATGRCGDVDRTNDGIHINGDDVRLLM